MKLVRFTSGPNRFTEETQKVETERKQMPPLLILALVGAVLALLAKDEKDLPEQQREELEKLQKQLAEARRNVRHAQNAKKRFVAQTGASIVNDDN
jgi:hypothetical protein